MGNWNSYFWLNNKPKPVKVLIGGFDAAGKTTILYCMKSITPIIPIPTIGFNVETFKYKNFELIAWDVGGRDKGRALIRHYFPHTEIFIYVIDSNDHERMAESGNELLRMLNENDLKDCMILVIANKQDLKNALSVEEVKKRIEFDKITQTSKNIFGISAITGDGLNVAFDWIINNYNNKDANSITEPFKETFLDVFQRQSWSEYFINVCSKVFFWNK
ncbi:unnamed protein product [Brachionus calyciflorus]|uniref:ADP-ribosylation factor n=1 Tax=Brachionus calyciflorus TaxID=104777 RepID=A0A813PS50_9BILA|nr:unnamed protein product [Brachionus calyciflorus]